MNEERSRRGRRPVAEDEANTPVCTRLPNSTYDRAFDRAKREGVSVPAVVRRALDRYLDDDDADV